MNPIYTHEYMNSGNSEYYVMNTMSPETDRLLVLVDIFMTFAMIICK